MSRMSEYQQRQKMVLVIQTKISHYHFFHKRHLWHVGRQLAVVLLYILHQKSVFEAIWQELT